MSIVSMNSSGTATQKCIYHYAERLGLPKQLTCEIGSILLSAGTLTGAIVTTSQYTQRKLTGKEKTGVALLAAGVQFAYNRIFGLSAPQQADANVLAATPPQELQELKDALNSIRQKNKELIEGAKLKDAVLFNKLKENLPFIKEFDANPILTDLSTVKLFVNEINTEQEKMFALIRQIELYHQEVSLAKDASREELIAKNAAAMAALEQKLAQEAAEKSELKLKVEALTKELASTNQRLSRTGELAESLEQKVALMEQYFQKFAGINVQP